MNDILRALTIWQPWASLWAIDAKEFETRSWKTDYRGPIAIHAASMSLKCVLKSCFPLGDWNYHPDYEAKRKFLSEVGKYVKLDELPFGAIIATAELVGCHKMVLHGGRGISSKDPPWLEMDDGIYEPTEQELMFGNWTPGRYAWEIANVKPLDKPVKMRGSQGLWTVKDPEQVLKGA